LITQNIGKVEKKYK